MTCWLWHYVNFENNYDRWNMFLQFLPTETASCLTLEGKYFIYIDNKYYLYRTGHVQFESLSHNNYGFGSLPPLNG